MNKWVKIIDNVMSVLSILGVIFIIWCCINYVEILCKHNSPNPDYSDYNMIVNVVEYFDEKRDN